MVWAKYPRKAAKRNQEGWVHLGFRIDKDGGVVDITVIDVSPKGYGFEKEAIRALKKWKYEQENAQESDTVIEFYLSLPPGKKLAKG